MTSVKKIKSNLDFLKKLIGAVEAQMGSLTSDDKQTYLAYEKLLNATENLRTSYEPAIEIEDRPTLAGRLSKRIGGVNGLETPEVGKEVYELGDKYVIYMKSERTGEDVPVKYYKDTLQGCVETI